VPWNGFSPSVQIGRLAEACEINIAPHNYYSHLADLHALHLCAVLPNVRIMEIDIDDVPWKGTLVTRPPEIRDGHIWLTDAPGRGGRRQREGFGGAPLPAPGRNGPPFVLRHGPPPDDGAPVRRAATAEPPAPRSGLSARRACRSWEWTSPGGGIHRAR